MEAVSFFFTHMYVCDKVTGQQQLLCTTAPEKTDLCGAELVAVYHAKAVSLQHTNNNMICT